MNEVILKLTLNWAKMPLEHKISLHALITSSDLKSDSNELLHDIINELSMITLDSIRFKKFVFVLEGLIINSGTLEIINETKKDWSSDESDDTPKSSETKFMY